MLQEKSKNSLFFRIMLLTTLIEGVTILFRYGFALKATESTRSTIGVLTMGLRIHHGYIGVLLLLLLPLLKKHLNSKNQEILTILGASLLLSDLVHHFLVIWPIEGSPQFDFFY